MHPECSTKNSCSGFFLAGDAGWLGCFDALGGYQLFQRIDGQGVIAQLPFRKMLSRSLKKGRVKKNE